MRGRSVNLFRRYVIDVHGKDVWNEVVERAGTANRFEPDTEYVDVELLALIGAASETVGQPVDDVLEDAGRRIVASALIEAIGRDDDALEFFLATGDRIDQSIEEMPDVVVNVENAGPDAIHLEYRSPRDLCPVAVGIMEGVGEELDDRVTVNETSCSRDRGQWCQFRVERVE